MTMLIDFLQLWRMYRQHYPTHRAARYAWCIAKEINKCN